MLVGCLESNTNKARRILSRIWFQGLRVKEIGNKNGTPVTQNSALTRKKLLNHAIMHSNIQSWKNDTIISYCTWINLIELVIPTLCEIVEQISPITRSSCTTLRSALFIKTKNQVRACPLLKPPCIHFILAKIKQYTYKSYCFEIYFQMYTRVQKYIQNYI